MASGKNRPPGGQDERRRRPPPTIDLEATEVAARPAAAEPQAASPAEPPPPKPDDAPAPQPEQAKFVPPPPEQPAPPKSESPPPDPPSEPPPRRPDAPPDRGLLTWLPEELSWQQVGGAAAGACGGLLIVVLLWLLGAFSTGRDPASDLSPRLAAIERQLNDLAARPAPPSIDPKAIEAITARVGRLEASQSAPRVPVTDPVVLGRLGATENAARSAADNVAALSRRVGDLDTALRDTARRLDALSAGLAELQRTARAAAIGSDHAVRLALTASAMRGAVERGDPFATELAVAKRLASDPGVLAPLEPFATAGVPTEAALARELSAILVPLLRSAGAPPRDGGFLERLQANAEKLVRIRPVDETRGDDRGAILARAEARAAQGNVAAALAELAKLAPSARAPAEPWIAKAQARDKAIEASRRFAADAMAALKAAP
jgi:hypothetical protein